MQTFVLPKSALLVVLRPLHSLAERDKRMISPATVLFAAKVVSMIDGVGI